MKRPGRSKAHKDDRYRVPGLERGLAVLEYLDHYPAGRTMIEISRDLGLPKNAAFRVTLTLMQQGYLEREPDSKRLYLSRKVLALGYGALGEGQSLVGQSLEVMRKLRDIAKESVCLSILVEGEGFALETVPGVYSFRCVVDPGVRLPLHASSASKAILGYLPENEQETLLASVRLTRLTPHTITQKSELRKELKRIRECGYAWDRCEHIDGVVCVSAPIFNRHRYPVASLAVTGPAGRMPAPGSPELGQIVRQHADMISARLGAPQE